MVAPWETPAPGSRDLGLTCTVCGEEMADDEGMLVGYRGRLLAFRCEECLERFLRSPDGYGAAPAGSCCPSPQECSPASEWSV